MSLLTRRDGDLITGTDPTAKSLRHVLHTDLAAALIADRQREVRSFVRNEHLAAALEAQPPRRSGGLRHALAGALIALARRLDTDSLEAARAVFSPQLD